MDETVQKNQNMKSKGKKKALSKNDVKEMKKRMAELKKKNTTSTQSFIPYTDMLPDGICRIAKNTYNKTIQFYDINYRLASFEEMERIFSAYCDMLNYFDDSIKIQMSFANQNRDMEDMLKELDIPAQDDAFNDIRNEYSEYIKSLLVKGTNGKVLNKYITYTIEANSLKDARIRLENISDELLSLLKKIGVRGRVLDGEERLEVLYSSLNPFDNDPFLFDWDFMKKSGMNTKDFVAPSSLNFKKSSFEIGKYYGAVYSLNIMSGQLSDEILDDFLKNNHLFAFDMHVEPFDQMEAINFIKDKVTSLKSMKIDEQKAASRSGFDPNIISSTLETNLEGAEKVQRGLNDQNERLFRVTFIIRSYAKTKKMLAVQEELLKRIAQKNNCRIMGLDYMQERSLASTLPLGYNAVPVNRVLTTTATAIFLPFTTQEIFHGGQAIYYGRNDISKNLILASRKEKLNNPNGIILGPPGSGKSFAAKREILDVFLKTNDDIFVCDPEGEYYLLVGALNGQVIKISADSYCHINPMDVVWDESSEDENENPITIKAVIADKSDLLISLMELVVGGSLSSTERTMIDKCVQRIYGRFFANNPSKDIPKERMPILEDLWKELKNIGPSAQRVADSLEMYVTGSHNLFNHHTNVDMQNRIICFDIRDLGKQVQKIAMLILQNTVWSRVATNRDKKSTWYYIDEFHLLLREEQTAAYSVEMWKRFRKWGGIPTGITQNVKDLLASDQIQNIFENSSFYYLLNQSSGDRKILQKMLEFSDEEAKYITNSDPGHGLICFGHVKLPFIDDFPKNTAIYKLLETTPKTTTPSSRESESKSDIA